MYIYYHVFIMSSEDGLFTSINKSYDKVTYAQKHGLDMWLAIIICILFFIMITYFNILNNLQPIKSDWTNQRCNPEVLPFAGIINNGSDTTPMEYTANNFTYCIRSILENIANYSFQPIRYMLSIITSSFVALAAAINAIREMFNYLRTSLTNITTIILGKALNFIIPVIQFVLAVKEVANKSAGAMAASINSVMAAYLGVQSLMLFIVKMFIVVLVAIGIIVGILWTIWPFGIPFAIAGTVTFMLLLIPTIRIQMFMNDILDLQTGAPPSPPACFSKHTQVWLNTGNSKTIDNIEIGDILVDGSTVTGSMKLSSKHQTAYVLHGIVVTGNHSVYHHEKGWISVEEHPDSSKLHNFSEQFVYCINTDSKTICLGNMIYADWDDLDDIDVKDMQTTCVNVGLLPKNFTMKDIHYYLDNGFHEESRVELQYGKCTTIKDVEVGDILLHGEKVIGKVKIDAKNIQGVYYYDINGVKIKCSKNITIYDNTKMNYMNTSFMNGNEITGVDYLYHVVTDLGTLHMSGLKINDYNSGLEKFLKLR